MKKIILLFFSLFLFQNGFGQNLVPNPSFENYSVCPWTVTQVTKAIPWFQPEIGGGSADYYNACALQSSYVSIPKNIAGYQNARSGNGYAGFAAYANYHNGSHDINKEYIEVQLSSRLNEGSNYFVSFYVSRSDSSQYAIDAIGLHFSSDTVVAKNNLTLSQYIPQIINAKGNVIKDTINWVLISGSFVANGDERYMTVGNFILDSLTTIDSIGAARSINYQLAYYYIDDISVIEDTSTTGISQTLNNEIKISPNPSKGNFNIFFSQSIHEPTIMIFNSIGEKVFEKNVSGVVKEIPIHFSAAAGIYFLKVREGEKERVMKIAVQ